MTLKTYILIGVVSLGTCSGAAAFDIEAHRGGRALRPENTLEAFAHALSMGVNTLELDTGVTRDRILIVSHDRRPNPDLVRDPGGSYVLAPGVPFVDLTLAQVQRYDVGQIRPGSPYAAQFPDQQVVPNARIPTLAEVFALVRRSGDSNVRLNIETKISPEHRDETVAPEEFVRLLLALVRQENFSDRVTIQSFDWRTLRLVQQQAPEIPTVYLSQEGGTGPTITPGKPSPWTAGFDPKDHGGSVPRTVKAAGGKIWSPFHLDVDAARIREAHDLGLQVVVWTVNKSEDMTRLIDLGVDGIISDRPDLLREVARARGLALPTAAPASLP